jgi:hypothetical protein
MQLLGGVLLLQVCQQLRRLHRKARARFVHQHWSLSALWLCLSLCRVLAVICPCHFSLAKVYVVLCFFLKWCFFVLSCWLSVVPFSGVEGQRFMSSGGSFSWGYMFSSDHESVLTVS